MANHINEFKFNFVDCIKEELQRRPKTLESTSRPVIVVTFLLTQKPKGFRK